MSLHATRAVQFPSHSAHSRFKESPVQFTFNNFKNPCKLASWGNLVRTLSVKGGLHRHAAAQAHANRVETRGQGRGGSKLVKLSCSE